MEKERKKGKKGKERPRCEAKREKSVQFKG